MSEVDPQLQRCLCIGHSSEMSISGYGPNPACPVHFPSSNLRKYSVQRSEIVGGYTAAGTIAVYLASDVDAEIERLRVLLAKCKRAMDHVCANILTDSRTTQLDALNRELSEFCDRPVSSMARGKSEVDQQPQCACGEPNSPGTHGPTICDRLPETIAHQVSVFSKNQSSEAQREEATEEYFNTLDKSVTYKEVFQAGWDSCMRRPAVDEIERLRGELEEARAVIAHQSLSIWKQPSAHETPVPQQQSGSWITPQQFAAYAAKLFARGWRIEQAIVKTFEHFGDKSGTQETSERLTAGGPLTWREIADGASERFERGVE